MTALPTDIDTAYADKSPGDAIHQQHHDAIHAAVNDLTVPGAVVSSAAYSAPTPLPALGQALALRNAGSIAPVRWLTFGDSVAQKKWAAVYPRAKRAFGGVVAGAYFSGAVEGVTTNATTGAVTDNIADFPRWPSGLTTTFGAAATRTYGLGGVAFTCDLIRIIHLNDGGGTFKFQVDGVDNVTPAVTSDGSITVTTISVARAAHTVTVVQTSGTPKIVGVGMEDTTINGVATITVGQGGIALNSPTSQAWANFATFLSVVNPTVITLEMKEDSTYFAAALIPFFNAVTTGSPLADIVGIGSTPVANGDADQVIQNAQLRAACGTRPRAVYFDGYGPVKNFATLNALGWAGDGIHVDLKADAYLGSLMMEQLAAFGMLGAYWPHKINTASFSSGQVDQVSGALGDAEGSIRAAAPDVVWRLKRWLRGYTQDGVTEQWRLAVDGGRLSFLPQFTGFGAGMAKLFGAAARRVEVRGGDNDNQYADLMARSFVTAPATKNLAANGTVTLDLSLGGVHVVTLAANATSLAIANPSSSGQDVEVHFVQDATGGRLLTGSSPSIKFAGGTRPTLSTAPGVRDIVRFRQVSGSYHEVSRSLGVV